MVRLLCLSCQRIFKVFMCRKKKVYQQTPFSFKKCVNKLPLKISSPLSYARESFDLQFFRSVWC
ncbi:hypothetical protein Hanom_Chr09g00869331 [Helianthus anomalus]